MKVNEIIVEADQSRRGFLGTLGKGAVAAAAVGSGLGGLMGGAKDAKAATDERMLHYSFIRKIGFQLGILVAADKLVGVSIDQNFLRDLNSYLRKNKIQMGTDPDILKGMEEGRKFFVQLYNHPSTTRYPKWWAQYTNTAMRELKYAMASVGETIGNDAPPPARPQPQPQKPQAPQSSPNSGESEAGEAERLIRASMMGQ